jgi:choline-sulfatase
VRTERSIFSCVTALSLALGPRIASADHPVFDLIANRTLAHVELRGGLAIAAGAPGFARYIHFSRPLQTWKLRASEDGKKVALASTQAVLEVPLTANQAAASRLYLSLKSPTKQTVRATARGKASAPVPLGPGWQLATISLPPGSLSAGENKIVLSFAQSGVLGGQKASAAVEWIQVGGSTPSDHASPPSPGGSEGLFLPVDGKLAYYVQVPHGGHLTLAGDANGCTLRVRADEKSRPVVETSATFEKPVDLSGLSGHVVRLEIGAAGGGCKGAKIAAAALTTQGNLPTVRRAAKPRNVVFWMTDSTRADKYRVFNPKTRVETPVMDALAKKATLFSVAYVQGNESRVSHASLWTSMYPAQHRFISEKAKLDPKFVTLAEAIRLAGLYTAGFMANGFIDAFWGFAQGFDLLKNHIHDGGGLKAADLLKATHDFLLPNAKKPFFVYIGTIDAHVSWRAHSPWIEKYDPEPYSGPFVKACLDPQLEKIVKGALRLTERDKSRIQALYDSDVSYNDQQFGELLKMLEKTGHLDDTMIILSADHGDEFWDHGKVGHGQSLHEELVHTPLAIYYPPLFPPGQKVAEGVETVDLLPTIVDALGLPPIAGAQGESLIALAQGEGQGYPRPAISSQYELAHTMRLGAWKLWVGGSGEVKLINAATDPAGAKELSNDRPFERRFVTDALSLFMAYQSKWKKTRWGVASNHKPAFANDLEKN